MQTPQEQKLVRLVGAISKVVKLDRRVVCTINLNTTGEFVSCTFPITAELVEGNEYVVEEIWGVSTKNKPIFKVRRYDLTANLSNSRFIQYGSGSRPTEALLRRYRAGLLGGEIPDIGIDTAKRLYIEFGDDLFTQDVIEDMVMLPGFGERRALSVTANILGFVNEVNTKPV